MINEDMMIYFHLRRSTLLFLKEFGWNCNLLSKDWSM